MDLLPTGDIDAGTWNETPLFAKIDEEVASDSDEINSVGFPGFSGSKCNIGVGTTPLLPLSYNNHRIKLRAKATSTGDANLDIFASLMQGSGLIAQTGIYTIPESYINYSWAVPTRHISTITNYNDLNLKFDAQTHTGNYVLRGIHSGDAPPNPFFSTTNYQMHTLRWSGGFDFNLKRIDALISRTGEPNGSIWFWLYSDNGTLDQPLTPLTSGLTPKRAMDIPIATGLWSTWTDFDYQVSQGVTYWLVYSGNGTNHDASNHIVFHCDFTPETIYKASDNFGVGWANNGTTTWPFKIFALE